MPERRFVLPLLAVLATVAMSGCFDGTVRSPQEPAPRGQPHRGADGGQHRQRALAAPWTVKLAAVGDTAMGITPTLPLDPASYLDPVSGELKGEVVFGNLESTLTDVSESPKCGPGSSECFAFRAPPEYARYLAAAGFTVMSNANNHSFDFGEAGEEETIAALRGAGIEQTGLPDEITTVRAGGREVAFVGFAPYSNTASLTDPSAARELIRRARRRAEIVVVAIHAGAEGSDAQHVTGAEETYLGEDRGNAEEFSHMAVEAGADLVLGSGPHVLRGIEIYRDRLIAYSLGNFSGYHNFNLEGALGESVVLHVTLAPDGAFRAGHLASLRLVEAGQPVPDPEGTAASTIAALSKEDFGSRGIVVDSRGRILRGPAPPLRALEEGARRRCAEPERSMNGCGSPLPLQSAYRASRARMGLHRRLIQGGSSSTPLLHEIVKGSYGSDMDSKAIGLRAQDVYSGLQTVDQTSGLIAAELDATRLTGMAATVAANIKGIDLIKDPKVLKVIAAQQWGIDSIALPQVLNVLEEVEYVTLHQDDRKNVTRIEEHIPLLHDDLYERLGSHWLGGQPSELDRAAVDSLELLAEAPMRLSDLVDHVGDETTVGRMLDIGDEAQFAKRLELSDGDLLVWSPYCAYEQPKALIGLFESFDEEEVRAEFARVREYQGLPIDGSGGVLSDAVGQGILLANAIEGSGGEAAFAFVPYRAGAARLRMEKVVLEKALVLLACVRYGENFAHHRIRMPEAILRKLRDGAALGSTTEANSQYRTAAQSQIVRLEPAGEGFHRAKLIDTPDNVAAVDLALDLLTHGEPVASREDPEQKLLFTDGSYLTPLMTMKKREPKARISGDLVLSLVDTLRGERGG